MRRRVRNAPAAEVAEGDEQSYQGEVPLGPPHRRRGRGRSRVTAAQEVEREQPPIE